MILVYYFYPGIRSNTQHLTMIFMLKFCIYFYFDHKSNRRMLFILWIHIKNS